MRQETLRRSPGRRLDPDVRSDMESRLGGTFAHVRLHSDAQAEQAARGFGARAFTIGSDVYFGPQQYQPHTQRGSELLAHELAHVMQESAARSGSRSSAISTPHDRSEVTASQAAKGTASATGPPVAEPLPAIHLDRDPVLLPAPRVARILGYLSVDGFGVDSASLTGDHTAQLTEHAQTLSRLLRAYPTGLVLVTGHTDATGAEAHNLGLGEERARAVAAALESLGVPAGAIAEDSAGESQLRVPTARQHPRNRRVEIRFQPETKLRLLDEGLSWPEPPTPPPDLRVPDRWESPSQEEEIERRIRDILENPMPPRPQGRPLNELVLERLDEKVDRATRRFPPRIRSLIKRGVRAAVERGLEEARDGLLDAAGIQGEPRQAIESVIEALGRTNVPR